MKVVEIFSSIEGEGKRTGLPVTFIRFYGCNLRCAFCDTQYSYKGDEYSVMSIPEIVQAVLDRGIFNITLTGGEPMMQPGIDKLIDMLLAIGCEINVETNGTYTVPEKYREEEMIFFTMDYKGPSSKTDKVYSSDCLYCQNTLRSNDVLKFVVGTQADCDKMIEVLDRLESTPMVFISPIFVNNETEMQRQVMLQKLVDYIMQHKLYNVRLQIQLHKVIWPADKRGV